MRRRVHSIRDKHKEAQILIRQDCFRFRATDPHARDFDFEGGSENIQRDHAGFEWQLEKFVVAGRVVDFREIVWRVWKRILSSSNYSEPTCGERKREEDCHTIIHFVSAQISYDKCLS